MGSTGRSEAPHLHYEIFKDGERINPTNFYYGNLSPEEFNEMLLKSQQENQSSTNHAWDLPEKLYYGIGEVAKAFG